MLLITYCIIAVLLLAAELAYFRIAEKYSIVDNPNNRSSHTGSVIRGGGIIFFIALLLWYIIGLQSSYFMMGATLLAVISFLDDIKPQRSIVRFTVHLIGVLLVFYQTLMFESPVWLVVIAVIICIGTINAFNFMDGINGITGIYALVNLGTFMYIGYHVTPLFISESLTIVTIIAVMIFLFFNFRKKAKCFAGDVGSVTLAFIQIYLLLEVIYLTENYYWVIMFLVYGIDSIITILYRLAKKENIFHAHRTHLYQYLSNELKMQHRAVSLIYGFAQLILNIILIQFLPESPLIPVISALMFVVLYVMIRMNVMKRISLQQA